jgi:hypothetical protein
VGSISVGPAQEKNKKNTEQKGRFNV